MRIKIGLTLIVCAFSVLSCETEIDSSIKDYFIKYYGLDGDQYGVDLVVNSDNTIVLLGKTEFDNKNRIYLVKTDAEGKVIWEKTFGNENEEAKDIELDQATLNPGGYLVLSNTNIGGGNTAIKIVRVDATGVPKDSILFNSYATQYAYSITSLSDGGFVFTGNTTADLTQADNTLIDPPDKTDLFSLRYDQNFIPFPGWANSFGGEPEAMGIKLFEVSPTQFDFAGYTNATQLGEPSLPANYDFNFWFAKLDGNGTLGLTQYVGGSTTQEKMAGIARLNSGAYMAVGTTIVGGISRIFASRIIGSFPNSDINDSWDSFEGEGVAVGATNFGKFLIVGNEITAGGSRDIWLTKVNIEINDEVGFPRSFGSAGNDDTASAVAELPNGDILVLGTMNLTNQNKISLIKIKSNGQF